MRTKLGLPGGSSCIHTTTESGPLSFTSNLANGLAPLRQLGYRTRDVVDSRNSGPGCRGRDHQAQRAVNRKAPTWTYRPKCRRTKSRTCCILAISPWRSGTACAKFRVTENTCLKAVRAATYQKQRSRVASRIAKHGKDLSRAAKTAQSWICLGALGPAARLAPYRCQNYGRTRNFFGPH